jgi:hypothetical protein
LNDILKIANILGKDYSFIIVGGRINKSAYKYKNITIIERTENQEKLAQLYSAADIFLNPTYEDNLPTTNIEAIACGTPVLTYNTGGSPEIIDKDTGFVVEKGDIEGICNILKNFTLKDKAAMAQKCRERAERYFNKDERFMDYIKLYEKVLKGTLMNHNDVLLITGGTGSFGNAVLQKYLKTDIKEIRIFSRDEKKQDDMRHLYRDPRIKYYIGDVRDIESVRSAVKGVDYIFHAAALKQVPSCEFYPVEAVKTNVLGADNVLTAAIEEGVKKVIVLSTDKAVYPINAMVVKSNDGKGHDC